MPKNSPEVNNARLNSYPPNDFVDIVIDLRCKDIQPFDYSVLDESFAYDGKRSSPIDNLPRGDGFFVAKPIFIELQNSGLPNRIDFEPESSLSIGRENSRHEVFFGELVMRRFCGKNDSQKIAVKPFLTLISERYLAQELAIYQRLRAAGVGRPEEVGIIKAGKYYFELTKYQPEIITQDSIDWKRLNPESKKNNIERALDSLVELHSLGISHGDAHPRNITMQPNSDATWHIDLEHGVGIENTKDLLIGIKQDLREYFKGLAHEDLLNIDNTFENLVNIVLEPYQTRVLKLEKSRYKSEITKLLPLICAELQREYEGNPVSAIERSEKIASLEKPNQKKKRHFRKN